MCMYCLTTGVTSHDHIITTQAAASHAFSANTQHASGNFYIADLVQELSTTGTAGTADYSITYSYSMTTGASDGMGISNVGLLTPEQQSGFDAALHTWASVANVGFIRTEGAAEMTIRQATMPANVAGWTATTSYGPQIVQSDIVLDRSVIPTIAPGNYAFMVAMHEIGHALGLKHPGNYDAHGAVGGEHTAADTRNASIMSYYDGTLVNSSNVATTPMIYDIAAAQYLYGANTSYNADDTVYHATGVTNAMAVWDGGGTDTLSASSYAWGSVIDLREGLENVTQVGNSVLWMAFGSNIENAVAGTGSDTLYGNGLSNVLSGAAGSDALYGLESHDVLYGNQDNDTLFGGSDSDALYGGKGDDVLIGGVSTGDATDSSDTLVGGEGSDVIYGNAGDDLLIGGTWEGDGSWTAETLYGGMGNDTMFGSGGNDLFSGGSGNDMFVFYKNNGIDVIAGFDNPGATGGDLIALSWAIFHSATEAVAATSYNSGNAVMDTGNGHSITILGVAAFSLTADDFQII